MIMKIKELVSVILKLVTIYLYTLAMGNRELGIFSSLSLRVWYEREVFIKHIKL